MNTFVQTPANNLKGSLIFYQKLDFTILSEEDPTLVSDGTTCIEIATDRYARPGIKLLKSNWEGVANKLKQATAVKTIDNGYLLSDPSGTWIYLIEQDEGPDIELPDKNTALGNNAGINIETMNIEQSAAIWRALGFARSSDNWPSFTNADGMTITLHSPNSCPHLFYNPSLTYFNGDNNLQIIEYIRNQQIPIAEEITYFNDQGIVDNVVLRDPGGLGFFVFSD